MTITQTETITKEVEIELPAYYKSKSSFTYIEINTNEIIVCVTLMHPFYNIRISEVSESDRKDISSMIPIAPDVFYEAFEKAKERINEIE